MGKLALAYKAMTYHLTNSSDMLLSPLDKQRFCYFNHPLFFDFDSEISYHGSMIAAGAKQLQDKANDLREDLKVTDLCNSRIALYKAADFLIWRRL